MSTVLTDDEEFEAVKTDEDDDIDVDQRCFRQARRSQMTALRSATTSSRKRVVRSGFAVGDKVRALYRGQTHYKFLGVVKKLNADGTYGIRFDDGDFQQSVGVKHVFARQNAPSSGAAR